MQPFHGIRHGRGHDGRAVDDTSGLSEASVLQCRSLRTSETFLELRTVVDVDERSSGLVLLFQHSATLYRSLASPTERASRHNWGTYHRGAFQYRLYELILLQRLREVFLVGMLVL